MVDSHPLKIDWFTVFLGNGFVAHVSYFQRNRSRIASKLHRVTSVWCRFAVCDRKKWPMFRISINQLKKKKTASFQSWLLCYLFLYHTEKKWRKLPKNVELMKKDNENRDCSCNMKRGKKLCLTKQKSIIWNSHWFLFVFT